MRTAMVTILLGLLTACGTTQGSAPSSADAPYPGGGAQIKRTNVGAVQVVALACDGPAHAAGLRRGDVITTVNGVDLAQLADSGENVLAVLHDYVRNSGDQAMYVTVMRNGELFAEGLPIEIRDVTPQYEC